MGKFFRRIKISALLILASMRGLLSNNVVTLIEFIEFYLYTWPKASIGSRDGERKSEVSHHIIKEILKLLSNQTRPQSLEGKVISAVNFYTLKCEDQTVQPL